MQERRTGDARVALRRKGMREDCEWESSWKGDEKRGRSTTWAAGAVRQSQGNQLIQLASSAAGTGHADRDVLTFFGTNKDGSGLLLTGCGGACGR